MEGALFGKKGVKSQLDIYKTLVFYDCWRSYNNLVSCKQWTRPAKYSYPTFTLIRFALTKLTRNYWTTWHVQSRRRRLLPKNVASCCSENTSSRRFCKLDFLDSLLAVDGSAFLDRRQSESPRSLKICQIYSLSTNSWILKSREAAFGFEPTEEK